MNAKTRQERSNDFSWTKGLTNRWTGATASELLIKVIGFYHGACERAVARSTPPFGIFLFAHCQVTNGSRSLTTNFFPDGLALLIRCNHSVRIWSLSRAANRNAAGLH